MRSGPAGFSAVLLLFATTSCGEPPPIPLAAARVPAHADLSGVRGVHVKLTLDPRALGEHGLVDLVRPDGQVVFTGLIDSSLPLSARIVMPTKDSTLSAILRSRDGRERSLTLRIHDGSSSGRFR
jgi:hypothetical protein